MARERDARPTLVDVARRAGVSRALASLAINGSPRVSPASREKVLAACSELGYRPNLLARSLASARSPLLGVLHADLANPFFARVADAVATEAQAQGVETLIATGLGSGAGELRSLATLQAMVPVGLVLVGPVADPTALRSAVETTPAISVSRRLDAVGLPSVSLDEATGTTLAVDHLVSLGHRRLIHVDGGRGVSTEERRRGVLEAVAAHRLAGRDVDVEVLPGAFTAEAGYRAAVELLAREGGPDAWRGAGPAGPPTGIVAGNDLQASGIMTALLEAGLRVPADVSVVGYDDTEIIIGAQGLTTVHQPVGEMGRAAVRAVLGAQPCPSLEVAPRLVVRRSTGPVRAEREAERE